jgi:dCMP deaminase
MVERGGTVRPTEPENLMAIARVRAQRATCTRGQVGCHIVDVDGHTVSTGYNGAPSGAPHCTDVGCWMVEGHCLRTIHAEHNALLNAWERGLSGRLHGATVYVTHHPCAACAVLLVRAGVASVVFDTAYGSTAERAAEYLRAHGVRVEQLMKEE